MSQAAGCAVGSAMASCIPAASSLMAFDDVKYAKKTIPLMLETWNRLKDKGPVNNALCSHHVAFMC